MIKKFKSFGSIVAFRVIISMAIVMIATFFVADYTLTKYINKNYENLLDISIEGIQWDINVLEKQVLKEANDFVSKKISPMYLDYAVSDGTVVYNGTRLPNEYILKIASSGPSGSLFGIPYWNISDGNLTAGVIVDEFILRRFVRDVRGNGFVAVKAGKTVVLPIFLKNTEIESVIRRGLRKSIVFVNDQRYFFKSFSQDGLTFYTFLSATVFDEIKFGLLEVLVLSLVIGISVVAYISHLVARYLSKSLRKILDGFEKLREGNFEFLDIPSHDELGMIMGEFNVTVAVLRDAMEKMKMAKEMAEEANRTKSMFLASVSHEIRNPLNSILGFTELLLKEEKDPKKREYLSTIYKSGEHLLNVINDILDLSKIEAGKMELVYEVYDPKKLVEEVVQMYQPQAMKKGIKIFSEIERDIPDKAVADPFRVKQILINLVSNAVKFTDEGYVKIRLYRDGEDLVYVVEDTGIGIPKEKVQKIFEPFTQADATVSKKYGGTGLGLSISKRLAKMMKGDLWIESDIGKGTKVYLKIPIKVLKEEDISKIRKVKNEKLAIVSIKSEDIKDQVVSFLRDLGFEITVKQSIDAVKEEISYLEPRAILVEVEKTSDVGGQLREIPTIAFIDSGSKIRLRNVLFLPIDIDAAEMLDDIMEFLDISTKEDISIAIVDDNDVNRTLISKMLDKISAAARKAEFEDGLQIVNAVESGEFFDLILLDVQMPNMDGYEACRRLREMEFSGKIILATGSTGQDVIKKMKESGCDDMIPKPVKIEDLEAKIWKYFPMAVKKSKKEKPTRDETLKEVVSEEIVRQGEVPKSVSLDEKSELETDQKVQEEEVNEVVDSSAEEVSHATIEIVERAVQKMENEMGMDREVAVGMLSDYIRFLKRKLKSLNDSIAKASESGIRRVAHDLAGSGEMYGLPEISDMGRKMSEYMNEKDFDGVRKLSSDLERFVITLEKALKNYQLS